MKIMGTGSRAALITNPKAIYARLEEHVMALKMTLEANGEGLILISGMAEGWDEMIARLGQRREIPYICVLPTKDYINYYWSEKQSLLHMDRRHLAQELLDSAFDVMYLDDMFGKPHYARRGERGIVIPGPNYYIANQWVHANMARNSVMVAMCDEALVYNPSSPGTKDAVARLNKANKPYTVYPF